MGNPAPFVRAREFLLAHRTDYATAYRDFRWPQLDEFNWALDWFDPLAAGNDAPALWIVEEDGSERKLSFRAMAARSNRAANFLRAQGVRRGDRILLMMGNEVALWEIMLAAMKLGAVVIPATTLLTAQDVQDRVERGQVKFAIAAAGSTDKFAQVGAGCARIAVVFSRPSTHRTLQLKADDARVRAATSDEAAIVATYVEAFGREIASLGHTDVQARTLFAFRADDLVAIDFTPNAAFEQTPGPKAGSPLKAAS